MKRILDFWMVFKKYYVSIVSILLLVFFLLNSLGPVINISDLGSDYVETTIDIDLDDEVYELISDFNNFILLKFTFLNFLFTSKHYMVINFPLKAIIPPPDNSLSIKNSF